VRRMESWQDQARLRPGFGTVAGLRTADATEPMGALGTIEVGPRFRSAMRS
jgi:hypothetical protein